jgi:hypothetical protein
MMDAFPRLARELAAALDDVADGLRAALDGRPQKVIANRIDGVDATLVSHWMSGARQLAKRNRLPDGDTLARIAEELRADGIAVERLRDTGSRIETLRASLEREKGWRSEAARIGLADAQIESLPGSEPVGVLARVWGVRVPALPAALVGILLAGGGFMIGGSDGGGSTAEAAPTDAPGGTDGERCSPWTDAGQDVELEACIRVKASRMLIRVRMRGPVGTRTDLAVQVYDAFADRVAGRELSCSQMNIAMAGEVQVCGFYEVRPPYGSEYAAWAKWRKTGEPRFGHEVLSPAMRW